MELTLKYARRLEKQIGEKLNRLRLNVRPSISISIFDDVDSQLNAANTKVGEYLSTYESLSAIRFGIRRSIEIANFNAGLNLLLNEEAMLRDELNGLALLSNWYDDGEAMDEHNLRVLKSHHDSVKTQVSTGNCRQEEITVDKYITIDVVKNMKTRIHNIKKRLEEILDACAVINTSKDHAITMMAHDADMLTKLDLM